MGRSEWRADAAGPLCVAGCLVKQLERVEASVVELKRNLDYAASVLEALCIEEARREISLLLFSNNP